MRINLTMVTLIQVLIFHVDLDFTCFGRPNK